MKTAFYIFKRDLHRIIHNPVAVIVLIGICVIPSLYAWFNIAANMDPYQNTQGIKVAVVNEDQEATTKEIKKYINAGDLIVENIKKNDKLGWEFVDREDAIEGVKKGEYYAAILIPSDFTKSLMSVLSGNVQQPNITYYVNEKKNAIAPKITGTGMLTLQDEINKQFSKIVSKTLTNIMAEEAESIIGTIDEKNENLISNIEKSKESIENFQNVVNNLKVTMGTTNALSKDLENSGNALSETATSGLRTLTATKESIDQAKENLSGLIDELKGSNNNLERVKNEILNESNLKQNEITAKLDEINTKIELNVLLLNRIEQLNGEIISLGKSLDPVLPATENLLNTLTEENNRHQNLLGHVVDSQESIHFSLVDSIENRDKLEKIIKDWKSTWSDEAKEKNIVASQSLQKQLDKIATISSKLEGMLETIPVTVDQVQDNVRLLNRITANATDSLNLTSENLASMKDSLTEMEIVLHSVQSSNVIKKLDKVADVNPTKISEFMQQPVKVKTIPVYPVENYGSAMTPFYTNLAIWVGGIVLIAIIKMEVDEDDKMEESTSTSAYFGRLMMFVFIGLIQAFIICLGDIYLLKVQCESPILFILSGLVCSFAFINIIYSLSITFKHIGKALCILLVILQIPGGSGTYPIEMTPMFFQRLSPLLPFSYGINAFREAIAGVYYPNFAKDLLGLVAFVPFSLLVGLLFRPALLNLNALFDRKLRETEIMVCEEEFIKRKSPVSLVIRALLNNKKSEERLQKDLDKFEVRYRKRIKQGFVTIFVLPLIFLILMFSNESKIIFLILWIASIILIAGYLIFIEYVHENMIDQIEMSKMTRDGIIDSLTQGRGK
ncbi:TPA: YhgE/Pip domain-containing protein [Streptococcus suis]|nr:YhgE/Pip domain-containing protein [Streptococcus suis]